MRWTLILGDFVSKASLCIALYALHALYHATHACHTFTNSCDWFAYTHTGVRERVFDWCQAQNNLMFMQSQKSELYIRKLKILKTEDHEDQDQHSHWRPSPPRGSYLRIRAFPARHRKFFVTNISLRVSKTQLGLVGFNRISILYD
jgi:hypothetical protein